MARKHNLTNQKFGFLTAIEPVRRNGRSCWKCVCECGNITFPRTEELIKNRTKSCGCKVGFLIASKTTKPEAIYNTLRANYIENARKKNLEFALTIDEFVDLIQANCHYCDVPPLREWKPQKQRKNYHKQQLLYNGIDRIDSSIGYTKDNCVPCCTECNYAKSDMQYQEFIDWIVSLINFRNMHK